MPPGIGYPPGLLAVNDQTPPILRKVQARSTPGEVPIRQMPLGERLRLGLLQAAGGPNDPNLSSAQNQQAQQRAMLMAGLQTMAAASQPGANFGGSIAHGLMAGQQAGDEQRQNIYASTQEERLKQALNNPAVVGKLSPEQLAMIQLMPPMEAVKALTNIAFAPPAEAKVVGEGAALVGADGKPIFTNERQADPWEAWPSEMRAAALGMGFTDPRQITPEQLPEIFQSANEFRRSGGTTVTVGTAQQLEKGLTDTEIKQYDEVISQGVTAEGTLANAQMMRSLLEGGLETGGVSAATMPLRRYAAQLGVADADKLQDQEFFDALAASMVPQIRQQMGNMGQLSDRDLEFLVSQVPQIRNTPGANKKLAEIIERAARRQMEIADLMDQYVQEHESLRGWHAFRRKWVRDNELYADMDMDKPAPWEKQ